MGSLIITEPTKVRIPALDPQQLGLLQMSLSYKDQKAFYDLQRMKHSSWYADKHGIEAYREELERLKSEVNKSLLFEDDQGLWTYSGLASKISDLLGMPIESRLPQIPEGFLGWEKRPEFSPYPYQEEALKALLAAGHAGVSIGTGLGKSLIISLLVKEMGLKTIVMAPSTDIAQRLYQDFRTYFGSKYVGFYGGGKKDFKKLITVGISASLTRIEEQSPAWKALSKAQVFIADESHLCPAKTLARVCFGLAKDASRRWFFSATQIREDGLNLLLDAITGPIVYNMTVKEGIQQGYLSKLRFIMLDIPSGSDFQDQDVNAMTRAHLYYNQRVSAVVGSMINRFVGEYDQQVLVLVEELEQFTKLLPYLNHTAKFAHGGVNKDNRDRLPVPYHESDPTALVKGFNAGEFPILVGTSCISTGTDIKANEVTFYLQGGKSMVSVMQGPSGRSTRLFHYGTDRAWRRTPGDKSLCTVIDVDVSNIESLHRHAILRSKIYDGIYGPVQVVPCG